MKISDASKPPAVSKTHSRKAAEPAGEAAEAAPVDAVSFAGIPDEELTPRVRQALAMLMDEVRALRTELAATRSRIGELEQLADEDPLVGILNRRAFVRELNRALAMVERYGTPSSLVFADLNDLKQINDQMGHAAGDAALEHVATSLAGNVRQTDVVGRLGGDEFGIILIQTDIEQAREKADALAATIASGDVKWRDRTFRAHIACGVVEIKKGATADEALETADTAMYKIKKGK